jgi:hypothetical protein
MNLIYTQGASVEGRILRLMSRDPIATPMPIRDPAIGLKYTFRLTQDSEAEIEGECDPKVCTHCPKSTLTRGDTLRASRISGFSTSPIGKAAVVQGSQNHRASQARCHNGYAQIDIPLRNILGLMARPQISKVETPPAALPPQKKRKAKSGSSVATPGQKSRSRADRKPRTRK